MNELDNAALRVALIGCGKMGAAIALGLLERDSRAQVLACDPSHAARAELTARAHERGVSPRLSTAGTPPDDLEPLDCVIVAVKPHLIENVLRGLPVEPKRLVVSVAAGVETPALRSATRHRVVRVMPNTPSMVGQGTSGVLADAETRDEDVVLVRRIFDALGTTVVVRDEPLMHVVTALSGGGPAYAAMIVEALADGAVAEGLPRDTAYVLARSTLAGTMTLLEQQHPGVLKDGVCSPGGTTIAAVTTLEKHGLRNALVEAVRAAANRSRQLAKRDA